MAKSLSNSARKLTAASLGSRGAFHIRKKAVWRQRDKLSLGLNVTLVAVSVTRTDHLGSAGKVTRRVSIHCARLAQAGF